MNRLIAICIFYLITNICFGKSPSDSLYSKIVELQSNYKRSNDSLQRELLIYKAKEDFYSDAYSSQGTLYTALISVISGLFIAIGFGVFETKFKALQKQINKINEDTALLHDSSKINFATSLLSIGYHAHLESDKSYNEDRYSACIISGFQAIRQYCTAFSFNTRAVSQEQINQMVFEVMGNCGASVSILLAYLEDPYGPKDLKKIEQIFNFKHDLKKIIEDTTLDDKVSVSVTGNVRASYYNLKNDIKSLLKGIEVKSND